MKLQKLIIVSTITLALAGQFSTLTAKDSIDQRMIDDAMPMVATSADSFLVEAPYINNLVVMDVRVYNHLGHQVLYVRSKGEAVELLATDLPDGEYHYQVNTVFSLDEPAGEGIYYRDEGLNRKLGHFTIKNASVVQPDNESPTDTASLRDFIIEKSISLIAHTLTGLVSSANADTFSNVAIQNDIPRLYFYDTSEGTSIVHDFALEAVVEPDATSARWRWFFNLGPIIGGTLFQADFGSDASLLENSMTINPTGDISWAGGGLHFNRASQSLSIGGMTDADLGVSGAIPNISFHDYTDTSEMDFRLNNGIVQFWGRPDDAAVWNDIINFDVNAPDDSLVINNFGAALFGGKVRIGSLLDSEFPALAVGNGFTSRAGIEFSNSIGTGSIQKRANELALIGNGDTAIVRVNLSAPPNQLIIYGGNIGMGTTVPEAALEIERNDGSAQIQVEETSEIAGPRTLFRLKNMGNTKFGVHNTEADVEWAFANPGTGFRLSRQGSGVVEMEIFNNGNMTIAGVLTENSDVNAKTAISEINSHEILNLVAQLPVSKWEYKDARGEAHIGPMAQDFYAAFGLGATKTGISTIDTAGVALVAIKALHAENQSLKRQNVSMQAQNTDLQERLEKLERQQSDMQVMMATFIEAQQIPAVLMKTTMN